MKDSLRPLASKEVKEFKRLLKEQWGFEGDLDYQFLLSSKQKVYVVNRDISRLDLSLLRVNSAGIYFAEWKDKTVRLSIEGAQMIGPSALKNVVSIPEELVKPWFLGEDLEVETQARGFVILKRGDDFLGCGRVSGKKIVNFVSKARKFTSSDLP